MKKLLYFTLVIAIVGVVAFVVIRKKSNANNVTHTEITAIKGDLTEKALAVGKIDPDHEIVIKSQVSGTIESINNEVGTDVKQGDPLLVVKPEPTPLELAEAQRQLELTQLNSRYLRNDLERAKQLYENKFIPGKDYENALRLVQEAELREKQAKERLELLESGSSIIGDVLVESVIRAPTDGTILERLVNVGDPVVPLTSYQPGTELMRIASMDNLIFIGTVDEIDVGKIKTGMKANIRVGALPKDIIEGELYFISPKSRLKDNVVVFDIKIRITDNKNAVLRAGYSASADLIIEEKLNVLHIPERVVEFRGDSTFVKMLDAKADSLIERQIKLGFSDGLSVEVVEGLDEGEKVVEN